MTSLISHAYNQTFGLYSTIYNCAPTRVQNALSAVHYSAAASVAYYIAAHKSWHLCDTSLSSLIEIGKSLYVSGRCVTALECSLTTLSDSFLCEMPVYVKGPLYVVAAGCALIAAKNIYSAVKC